MANTVNVLSYTNTFGDWMITTNNLAKENNDLAANNYIKSTGTLYLNEPTLGLQVSNTAIVGGQLQVQGVGSSAYIQNNLRVDTQVYFTNTALGLTNSGQMNVGGVILALASGTGINVSNNAIVGGTINVGSNASIGGNTTIGGFAAVGSNVSVGTTITVGGNASIGGNTTIGGNLNVANNLVVTTGSVTSTLPVIAPSINISTSLFANTANGYVNNFFVNGQLSVNGNFVLTGTTVYDTNIFTINNGSNVGLTSYFGVHRGQSGVDAELRWNESTKAWELLDVSSNNYYSITTTKTPSNITFIGSTTTSTITSNGVLTITSNNGVITSGTSNTLTISTPQDIRTSASPTFNALTLTNALGINQGGTGASSSSQALTNILPTGTTSGYVLTTGGPGSFYWAAGGTGGAGATPGTTIQSTRLSYTGDGTTTLYTAPTYIPGDSQLRLYIDGVRQFGSAYTETSNTSVTLSTPAPNNSKILVEIDGYVYNPYYANNIAYTINSNISSTANTIQLALDGLTSKLITYYANTSLSTTFANTVTFSNGATLNGTVSLGTPLAISSGGTGATSSTQALTNILPTGTTSGYVLTTGGAGSFYWAAASGGGGATPGTTINTTRIYPTVNASQTSYTTPTYTPGSGQLRVYINGVRQFGSEYTETSNTSVTLGTGTTAGDVVLLEVDGYINNPYYANTIAFTVNSNISSTANTIQLAIDGLTTKLTTYYANTSSSYTNPTWITSLASTKITGTIPAANISGLATSATTDTSNATNITSGTLSSSRIPTLNQNTSGTAYNITQYTVNQSVGTGNSVQFNSLGVGTAASGVSGEIRAIDNITAYYSSDISLKENINDITNAVDIIYQIGGKTFDWTDDYIQKHGGEDDYFLRKSDFGVIAQDVKKVFPLAVRTRSDGLLAVDYEKLCTLAFAAIKELKDEIEILKGNSK